MDQMQIVHDMLRMLRRRAIPIALCCLLGIAAAAAVALTLPPRYETSARIVVESQKIPDELARSTVTSSAVERLNLIEQRLMARDNVAALIERLGLYADKPKMTQVEKIAALRAATRIESQYLGPTTPNSAVASSSISITVTYGDPVLAAEIANELVAAMLAQNLETRSAQTRETLRFFDEERDRLAAEIGKLDREITAFKTENEALLPDSLEFRRDEMGRLLESSLEIDRRILTLEDQRGTLRSGLADDDLIARPLSPEATLLRELETDLAQKQLKLAPNHPEIRDLRGRIEAVRNVMGADRTAATAGEAALSARERSVRRQVELLDSQIALLENQRRELGARRSEIEASLQQTPTIETTLAKLERRRDALLEQYSTIIAKRAEAETGERLEETQQAERFEVIEDALPPEHPFAPKRKQIVALGAGASLGLGIALAFLIEMLNPALRSSADFQRQLQIAPLAAIPYVRTRRERRMRLAAFAAAALLLIAVLPAGLWAIDRYVRPLSPDPDPAVEETGLDTMLRSVRSGF